MTNDPKYCRYLPLKINDCAPPTLFRGIASFRAAVAGSSAVEKASQQGTNSETSCAGAWAKAMLKT